MLSTFHLITGAAISSSRLSFVNAVAASFVSHFLLDALPHWDFIIPPFVDTYIWAWLDMLIGWSLVFALLYVLRFRSWFVVFCCASAAIFPDVVQFFWTNYLPSYLYLDAAVRFHMYIQWDHAPMWFGIVFQTFILICMVSILFRKRIFAFLRA